MRLHMSWDMDRFLQDMDLYMCHPDRKYWMVDRDGKSDGASFTPIATSNLAIVYEDVLFLAGLNAYDEEPPVLRSWSRWFR